MTDNIIDDTEAAWNKYIAQQTNPNCFVCNKRLGTMIWTESAIAMIHGAHNKICEICVLTKQIEHAVERKRVLPSLEKRLATLLDAEQEIKPTPKSET